MIQWPSFTIREPVLSFSVFVLSFKCQLHPKAGFLFVVGWLSVAFGASCFLILWGDMGTSYGSFKIKEEIFQKSPANLSSCLIDQNWSIPIPDKIFVKKNGINLQAISSLGRESSHQLSLMHTCEQQE